MITRQQLFQTPEYWMERIQNDLFRALHEYKESNGFNQTQLAKNLGFTKGYISQVLNGNFNFSLRKMVDLALAVGVVPDIEFKHIQDYIDEEERRLDLLSNHGFSKVANMTGINVDQKVSIDISGEPLREVG